MIDKIIQPENLCEQCDKPTEDAYEMQDGSYVCLSCYEEAVERAEMAYEDMLENQATGN